MNIRYPRISRFFACVLLISLVALAVFSFLLFSAQADHICTGEHCRFCLRLEYCIHLLKIVSPAFAVSAILLGYRSVFYGERPCCPLGDLSSTPILLKVKLSE